MVSCFHATAHCMSPMPGESPPKVKVWTRAPEAASHSLHVLSPDAVSSWLESGLNTQP